MDRDAIPLAHSTLERLEALGVPVARVWARVAEKTGLATVPPPASLSTDAFFAFWEAVDAEAHEADLGLRIGTAAVEKRLSVATMAGLQAQNLDQALATVARYKRITCPELVELEVEKGEASVRFRWMLAASEVPRLLVDGTFASFVAIARKGTGGKVSPLRIELARREEHGRVLRRHFGCAVVFGARVDRIVFAESALEVPFVTANAEAFSRLVPGLEKELVGRPGAGSLRDDVRVAIARGMSSGARPHVEGVARRLGVSPRTLQRRLGEEGTSYQGELDRVRRTSARRLLANTALDQVDIAFLLGFEELNSFARAFRVWERMTPLRYRERAARA